MQLPQRIVSLVPSTTETVCSLGAGAALVGCTRYCTEPRDELLSVARVGGTKNPAREAIAGLAPDLVLANAEENRAEDIAWLQQRVPVLVQTPRNVRGAAEDLRALAVRLGASSAVLPFLLRIESQLTAAQVAGLEQRPLRVFYAIWRTPWMSIGRDTFIHDVLRCVGATNVCGNLPARYPEVTPEWVRDQHPEAVLLPSEPWAFDEADCNALRATRTFGCAAVQLCDGRDYCWHGTRMADGLGRAAAAVARLRNGPRSST